jgi:hypothetical protein
LLLIVSGLVDVPDAVFTKETPSILFAEVAVAALPVMLIPHVPLAPEPVVDGAPISLRDHATLALPLKVLPVDPMVRVLAVVSVAAEPVVFWFQVGTVPVKPE